MLDIQKSLQSELEAAGLVPANAAWQLMTGGRSNLVWRVGDGLVCKLYREGDNPLFANSAADEFRCLTALQGQDLAPEPVGQCQSEWGDVIVYRHLDGQTWRDDVASVAQLLGRLHTLPTPKGLSQAEGGWQQIAESGAQILTRLSPDVAADLRRKMPEDPAVSPGSPCFIHGDVVPANIIVTPNGLRLIDWQSPVIGDPVWDLFCFLSPAMQIACGTGPVSSADRLKFLAAYPGDGVKPRLHALQSILHWRMAAYCAWRVACGDTVYRPAMAAELVALDQLVGQQAESGDYSARRKPQNRPPA